MRERPGPPGEDTPRADMYQLYRAADWTSPPAPVIAQEVTPTAASWCATDGGARPWKGCLRAGSRRGVQLARSGRHARTASAARARHSNAVRPAPGRDAVRQKPRQLYLAVRSCNPRRRYALVHHPKSNRDPAGSFPRPRNARSRGRATWIAAHGRPQIDRAPPPATLGEVRRARSANRARTMSSIDRSCPPPRVALLHEAITPARRLLWRAPTRSNGAPHEATHSAACPARCTRVRTGRPHGARRRWPQPAPARRV